MVAAHPWLGYLQFQELSSVPDDALTFAGARPRYYAKRGLPRCSRMGPLLTAKAVAGKLSKSWAAKKMCLEEVLSSEAKTYQVP